MVPIFTMNKHFYPPTPYQYLANRFARSLILNQFGFSDESTTATKIRGQVWAQMEIFIKYKLTLNPITGIVRQTWRPFGCSLIFLDGSTKRCCQTNLNTRKKHIKSIIMWHRKWTTQSERHCVFAYKSVCFEDVFHDWSGCISGRDNW